MKDYYRKNVIDFALLQLDKEYEVGGNGPDTFDNAGFTYYIFYTLFSIDVNESGYGNHNSTKQITNNIGDLRQYSKKDPNKDKYLKDINIGDLVFFHRKSLEENTPTPSNKYPGYVGIYMGNKEFIHVGIDVGKVVISKLEGIWLEILVASRDIIAGVI